MLKITNSQLNPDDPLQDVRNIADPIEALVQYCKIYPPPRNKKEEKKNILFFQFMNLLSNVWNHYQWTEQIDEALGQAMNNYDWDQFFAILKSLKKLKNPKKRKFGIN